MAQEPNPSTNPQTMVATIVPTAPVVPMEQAIMSSTTILALTTRPAESPRLHTYTHMPMVPLRIQHTTTQLALTTHPNTIPPKLNTTHVLMTFVLTERPTLGQTTMPASNIRTLTYLLSPIPTLVSMTPVTKEPSFPAPTIALTIMTRPLTYPPTMTFSIVQMTPEWMELILQL